MSAKEFVGLVISPVNVSEIRGTSVNTSLPMY
jgi:hypothetical protein